MEMLEIFLGIEINEMQLQRITDHYGENLHAVLDANEKLLPSPQPDDSTYVMVDGSFVLTREVEGGKTRSDIQWQGLSAHRG